MRKFNLFVTMMIFFSVKGGALLAAQLPSDWLVLSSHDDKTASAHLQDAPLSNPSIQTDQQVEELFALSHDTIEEFQIESEAKNQSALKSRSAPWQLTGLVTSVGVSAGGGVGLVGISGASAVDVNWRRKEAARASNALTHATARRTKVPMIALDRFLSPQALEARADTLATLFGKTRRTVPHGKLKQRFYESLLAFQQVMSGLELSTSSQWRLSAVGIAFGVSASGAINIVTVGGEAQIILGWMFKEADATASMLRVPSSTRTVTPLQRVLSVVAEDLALATRDLDRMEGFKATSIEIGLSVSAEGTIGVATVGAEAGIVAQLTKVELSGSDENKMFAGPDTYAIEESETRLGSDLILAAPMGALAQSLESEAGSEKGLRDWIAERRAHRYERISRKKFRKTLERSFRMGQYFASRAARHEARMSRRGSRWEVGGLTLGLELALDGSVGVAQVAGTAALEVEFERE